MVSTRSRCHAVDLRIGYVRGVALTSRRRGMGSDDGGGAMVLQYPNGSLSSNRADEQDVDPLRRRIMRSVRSRDTGPELAVRHFLHRAGYRFRLHDRSLPGSPDLVLKRHRTVVFVHGCFWHRHPGCQRTTTPKTRRSFWESKFTANVARDTAAARALKTLGWKVIVVWECQTRSNGDIAKALDPLFGLRSRLGDRR